MTKYAKQLLAFRKKWNLSQDNLALLCNVSRYVIGKLERSSLEPAPTTWEKITSAIQTYDGTSLQNRVITPRRLDNRIWFEFSSDCFYIICTASCEGVPLAQDLKDGANVFRYVGKQGIHHVFRHSLGNWTRTYTDAQLIGKIIEEIAK